LLAQYGRNPMTLPGDHSADPDLALRIPRGDIARNSEQTN
jgi:hypothetical protein